MIPLSDSLPNTKVPIITYSLISLNVIIFLWELWLEGTGELSQVISVWGIIPRQISQITVDIIYTANPAAVIVFLLVSFRLITSLFFHISFGQILINMIYLMVFGSRVEELLQRGLFLLYYLVMGLICSLMIILIAPNSNIIMLGSNGAIAALLGVYLYYYPQQTIDSLIWLIIIYIPINLPAWFYGFWWLIQQLFYNIGYLEITGVLDWSQYILVQMIAGLVGWAMIWTKEQYC